MFQLPCLINEAETLLDLGMARVVPITNGRIGGQDKAGAGIKIGILEVILAILLLVPATTFLAAILLTGYLGGAVVTHLRVGEPIFMPIIMGIVMWIGLALRFPQIWRLSIGNSPAGSAQEKTSN